MRVLGGGALHPDPQLRLIELDEADRSLVVCLDGAPELFARSANAPYRHAIAIGGDRHELVMLHELH
jgi:hypothetical protein